MDFMITPPASSALKAAIWTKRQGLRCNTGTPKMGCRKSTCCVIESGYDWNTIVIVG